MTDKICFVIQPFSEPYNKRFDDIYKPAIEHVGLIPYRAGGPAAEIITEDIEEGIRNAHICFADITENNPNVWYEVGFAYARDKSVIMVCNKTVRGSKELPFDISVKNVIFYKDGVNSYDLNDIDSSKFTQQIIDQAKERVKKATSDIVASPVTVRQPKNSDNSLNRLDIAVLEIICEYDLETDNSIHRDRITSEFSDSERRKVLISLGEMEDMGYITKIVNYAGDILGGAAETVYYPTEKGRRWYRENNRD